MRDSKKEKEMREIAKLSREREKKAKSVVWSLCVTQQTFSYLIYLWSRNPGTRKYINSWVPSDLCACSMKIRPCLQFSESHNTSCLGMRYNWVGVNLFPQRPDCLCCLLKAQCKSQIPKKEPFMGYENNGEVTNMFSDETVRESTQ